MKKKGPRGIPDFSSKRPPSPGVGQQPPATKGGGGAARTPARGQTVNPKPQATSAKSGRRGG